MVSASFGLYSGGSYVRLSVCNSALWAKAAVLVLCFSVWSDVGRVSRVGEIVSPHSGECSGWSQVGSGKVVEDGGLSGARCYVSFLYAGAGRGVGRRGRDVKSGAQQVDSGFRGPVSGVIPAACALGDMWGVQLLRLLLVILSPGWGGRR